MNHMAKNPKPAETSAVIKMGLSGALECCRKRWCMVKKLHLTWTEALWDKETTARRNHWQYLTALHINTWLKAKQNAAGRTVVEWGSKTKTTTTKTCFLNRRGHISYKDHGKICAISFSAQMLLNWIRIREVKIPVLARIHLHWKYNLQIWGIISKCRWSNNSII